MLRLLVRRVLAGLAVLVIISFVSVAVQDVAQRTRLGQPAPPAEVLRTTLQSTVQIWRGLSRGDLGTYTAVSSVYSFYSSGETPLSQQLVWYMLNSLGILLLAMAFGGLIGGLIGVLAAAARAPGASLALVLFSILGISTPSFLLGMLLQLGEIAFYKGTGVRLVPVGGYGWDSHLVLPLLALSARPIAQVARLTYVRISGVLAEDYVRTAHSKGLAERAIWRVHVIPNAAVAVLTAIGTSVRFAMSSLPVVETLFGWPGAGRLLLDMLRVWQIQGATVVILCFGATILLINMLLDVLYRVVDPRLRETAMELRAETHWAEWLLSLLAGLWGTLTLRRWRERRRTQPASPESLAALVRQDGSQTLNGSEHERAMRAARRRAWAKAISGNQALWLGVPLGVLLILVVVAGPALAPHNPYSLAISLHDEIPPLQAPSALYPMGTDAQGRDVLSLLLVGARRTLSIALFAVVARLLIGGLLGFLAGWFPGSGLDRAIMGLSEMTASFPALLLAMLVIFAVGIREGLVAFVVGLALVGWAEVMQNVRGQVMALKPMAFIEGAVASGATEGTIMSAHVLPNLWPTMVSLAFLEMGGVLMLLGELGFLGVFIGRGMQAQGGDFLPTVVYYDIPEWSVTLASSRGTYRSYPWATLYPAGAFFLAIWAFTLLGEGLRRLTERLTLSFRSIFNRYIAIAAVVLALGARWMLSSTGYYATYLPSAKAFSAERALVDIRALTSSELNGRLSGSADADAAAYWLAEQFEQLGLQAAGERLLVDGELQGFDYYQHTTMSVRDLLATPSLTLEGPNGASIVARYGIDFTRSQVSNDLGGSATGLVDVVAERFPWMVSAWMAADALGISYDEVVSPDRFVLSLGSGRSEWVGVLGSRGTFTPSPARAALPHYLLSQNVQGEADYRLYLDLSTDLVERLLAPTGESRQSLERRVPQGSDDPPIYLRTGWRATVDVLAERREAVPMLNVLGYLPGMDLSLNSEVVIVSAYYDGLGRLPDGTLYPSANDNASGVATMLEMIRTLQEQRYQPRRSIVFVAWAGGQRHVAPDYAKFMQAHTGFDKLKIVAALELEGLGGGSGDTAVVWRSTSQRLTEVFRESAQHVGTPLDTRQTGLHPDATIWPWPHRDIPGLTLSWGGADALSAVPEDSADAIDPVKLGRSGRLATLAAMVLATDPTY